MVALISSQIDMLIDLAAEINAEVAYIKPHGALYNQAQRQADVAIPVVLAAADLPTAPAWTARQRAGGDRPRARRAFMSPRASPTGATALTARSCPGASLMRSSTTPSEIEAQVIRLVSEGRSRDTLHPRRRPRAVDQRGDRPTVSKSRESRSAVSWMVRLMGLIVIDPGLSTTLQDEGRPGYREWGVPVGGVFDRGSARLANALLGNPPGCAVLEMYAHGRQLPGRGPAGPGARRRSDGERASLVRMAATK